MNPNEGMCSHCGHINQADWVLCDKCGQRLPWAADAKPRKKIDEMNDSELAAFFAPAARRDDDRIAQVGLLGALLRLALNPFGLFGWLRRDR